MVSQHGKRFNISLRKFPVNMKHFPPDLTELPSVQVRTKIIFCLRDYSQVFIRDNPALHAETKTQDSEDTRNPHLHCSK